MGGLVGALAGAPYNAGVTGGYYQNAANQLATETGSPAAQMFSKEQTAALYPVWRQQQEQLTGSLAAQGIGPSGAGRAAMGNLGGEQAAAAASAISPLYQQALQQYGQIIGQMPGAQSAAYQQSIQDFYNTIQAAGAAAAGMPGGGGGTTPAAPGAATPWAGVGTMQMPSGMYGQAGYYG